MVDGVEAEHTNVDEISYRTDFDRIILYKNGWKQRIVIPVDSFISFTEED
jgi:hypothetical protein